MSPKQRPASSVQLCLTYGIVAKYIERLHTIIGELIRHEGETRWQLIRKAARSLQKESEIAEISYMLDRAVLDLTLGRMEKITSLVTRNQHLNSSSDLVARLPPAPFYGLPFPRLSRFVGREKTLSDLKNKLLQEPAKGCSINL